MKFVRGRVLRVALGGNDPDRYAVHLAKLRIADATSTMPAVAQQQSAMTASNTSAPNLMAPSSTANPTIHSATSATLAITGLTVSLNSSGAAVVTWNPLPVAAEYFVVRWNVNDPACCNAMSPPGIPLRSPVWQDSVLPVRGTYAYRAIARTASGSIEAQTLYVYGAAPTPPSGVASTGPVPINVPTSEPAINSPLPPPPTTAPTITTPTTTATGVPPKGTILTTEPAPSSGPRTVSIMPPTETTTAPPAQPTSSEPVTALFATAPTATGMVSPTISSGPGTPSSAPARYRVLLTGFAVAKQTNDDPLSIDGRGDEAFAAAAVVNWDRRTNQLISYSFVETRHYGDMGASTVNTMFPDRIQAGSFSPQGGLKVGDRVPSS